MASPPSKRLRGPVLDPFDEDFTQDDLNEIDSIASQAITTATGGVSMATTTSAPGHNGFTGTRAALESDSEHDQLKRKLEEAQEEMLLRSGEVQLLRDSLKTAQQETETHKLRLIQIQTQTQRDQTQRERDLLKKVQSLESQLQFKEAELNEIRSKRSSPFCRNRPQSSVSPSGGFITSESFRAQVRTTPGPSSANDSSPGPSSANDSAPRPSSANHTPSKRRKQEVTPADPFLCVRAPRTPQPGGVLLGLLLQTHRLSLCHLLRPTSGDVMSPGSGLSPVQKLALTGLNLISLNRTHNSGALLLLPFLSSYLSSFSSSLDTNGAIPSCTSAVPPCSRSGAAPQYRLNPEESAVVCLRTLTTLLQHRTEVVEAILSDETQKTTAETKPVDCVSQSALLPCLLRLCSSPHTDVACTALTALQVLVQKSPDQHRDRLRCVLSPVCACVSPDQRSKVLGLCLSVLLTLNDLGVTLPPCPPHEPCLVLRLLHFIRSRSDSTHSDWVQLNLKVVRFLSRILTQSPERSTNIHCPCYSEMVPCVVVVLHRLWLHLVIQPPPDQSRHVQASLQETVLLFHWLQQNHSNFTENLRGVFHLYNRVVPALRKSLRETCYCHELALDEICRSEPDDDMDTDSGS